MSRIAKWKLEKTKVKVVFRVQFHATQIPQTGWDKLFVSFIPADSVKATAKTSKASVRNGTCKWADPIYETTRLIQDTKTKQYDEKRYKLVVAMGSSRSGFLGEANFNLADYADAAQPSAIALPLQGCNFGTVLHVTVQPLSSKTGFREFEQQRELRETGLQTTSQSAHESAGNLSASVVIGGDQIDKVNARVRFKSESRELPSLEEVAEFNEDYADSATGIDVSSNTSGSLYADKHDSSTHEIESLKSTTSGDLGGLSLSHSPHPDKGDHSDHRLSAHRAGDWVHGWSSDYSLDNDLAAAYEENSRLRGSLDVAESSILELKLEVSSLQNHANELGSKTQNFAQVLDAEIVSGEELANEVSVLKSEYSKFKDDLEQLKHSKLSPSLTSGDEIAKDQVHLFEAHQTRWVQGLVVMEEKVREIQNKACHEYHERDFSILHPDFESLVKVMQDLKQGTTQVLPSLNVKPALAGVNETVAMSVQESEQFLAGDGLQGSDTDTYQYEGILRNLGRPAQVSHDSDYVDATIALEAKISELHKELEGSKFERDSLTRKLDQMECYYEALIQELEESQKQMLGELQSLRTEHSTCLYTISSCKSQMEAMHQDMNTQFLRFAEDRRDLESLNKELEQRAITSETALKRARWNYSVVVGQLQKDLELLSFQVLSMFETNENLIRQAFTESSQGCLQEYLNENSEAVDSCLQKDYASLLQEQYTSSVHADANLSQKTEQVLDSDQVVLPHKFLEENKGVGVHEDLMVEAERSPDTMDLLIDPKTELRGTNTKYKLDSLKSAIVKPLQCQNHNAELTTQLLSGEVLFGDMKRSLRLQEALHQKAEDELCEMHVANLNLDVFSKVLQETLNESTNGIKLMKEKLDELVEQLAHSTVSNELLMLRLQEALDDVNTQKQNTADCITMHDELALQNQKLEEKLQGISNANYVLTQKVSEYERLIMECRRYENKYEVCIAEKTELLSLLKQEALEKCGLQSEVSSLHEELKNLKSDFDIQSSFKGSLESTVSSLQDKLALQNQMLEEKQQISDENYVLAQKVSEYERMIMECSSYERKYEVCIAEKTELLSLLKQEALEKCGLQSEVSSLHEELKNLKSDFDIQSSFKGSLESTVSSLQDKLALQNQMLEEKQQISDENYVLAQKVSEYERMIVECSSYESKYEVCIAEKTELLNLLKQEALEKCGLQSEVSSLHEELKNLKVEFDIQSSFKSNLEQTVSFLQDKLRDMMSTMVSYDEQINGPPLNSTSVQQEVDNKNFISAFLHLEQLQEKAYEKIVQLIQEKKDVAEQRDIAQGSLSSMESEIVFMKQKYESDVQDMVTKLDISMAHLGKLQLEIETVAQKLKLSSEADERYAKNSKELSSKLAVFEAELQNVTSESWNLSQKILSLENVNEELERTKLTAVDAAQENQTAMISLHASIEESVKLANELKSTNESLRCVRDELLCETGIRVELENKVADLSSQLNVKNDLLLSLDMHKTELVHLKQLLSDMEQEKSRVCWLLLNSQESQRKADADASSLRLRVADLETHLAALHEYLLAADVELIFTRNQFQSRMQELVQQLESLDRCYRELHFKHLDVLNTVNDRIASKAQYVEENAGLLSTLNSLRFELNATIIEKKNLLDRSNIISAELEKHKSRADVAENSIIQDKLRHENEIEHLKHMILSSEEVIDNLSSSREELEITVVVLRNKLDEQRLQLLLLEEYGNELTMLRNQQKEITQKLSEQILKTEEFKNLSIHLKELKDKADAECLQAREKREAEGPPTAAQESLRMVFVREQCETKLQEMRSQLFGSQKHGEEMLLKLQDALDEVENRKKTEASHINRNEELSLKIQELDSELQAALADKRDKVNTYDRMKAELECSLISLECCKEEKQKLEASLQECNKERYKLAVEVSSMKERLESVASSTNTQVEGNSKPCVLESMSTESVTEAVLCEEVEDASGVPLQDGIMSKSVIEISRQAGEGQEDLPQNNAKRLAVINERVKAQSLMSSMDHLHKELERMKNENLGSLLPQDQQHFQPVLQGLQGELLQLQKTNEQLRSIFPLFSEFSSCGNSLERVLALEMELAEALQAKRKSNVHFQSSFLKQHSDEEAIFQSFKDINELIKDMLELKGKYVTVETELKEMHNRYSQLSLQFAEVEGERQKLVMTLKNARSPKKLSYLYRSASDSLGDHS